jgi:hypothetical protein
MSLPYESATSGKKAIDDMQKILQAFGCSSFGHMMDFENGTLLVQFVYRSRQISVKASAKGYAAAWLRKNPHTNRTHATKSAHEAKALKIGTTAVYSILRDWIKGQITAVETGVLSFEGAFLGQILLGNGQTVLEHATSGGLLALENSSGQERKS